MIAVRGHPHDRRVLAAVGADRAQLVAVQAVHAPVAARAGSSAAATARGSSGTPCRASTCSLIVQSSTRRVSWKPAERGLVREERDGARPVRTRARREAAPRSRPGRACRSTTPPRRPDGPPPARRAGSRRCSATRPAMRSGVIRQRRSRPRLQRAEARARRVGEHAVERAVGRAARPRRRPGRRRSSRPCAPHVVRSCSARSGSLLDADDLPRRRSMSAARCVALAARRGAEVEHALAGLRAEERRDALRGARHAACSARGATARGRGRRTGRRAATASGAPAPATRAADRRGELLGRRLQPVGAQRRLGRLVERGA